MAATTYQIIPQKSKGLPITITFGGFNATGKTAKLNLQIQTSQYGTVVTLPLTVSGDGLSGTYLTSGTDFPQPGIYAGEVEITDGSGNRLYSAKVQQMYNITSNIAV